MAARSRDELPSHLAGKRIVRVPEPDLRPDFRPEFLDFERGIRMGNIEPNQRLTRILRASLEARHGTKFITDRWGRGVYWKWICWVPVESRKAKPVSGGINFGSAKFYTTINQVRETFEAGMQVERAPLEPGIAHVHLQDDWDYHALVRGLRSGSKLARQIARLVRDEGFTVRVGGFREMAEWDAASHRGPAQLARALKAIAADAWGGFQLCYVWSRKEISGMSGAEIIAAIEAVFGELVPPMNAVLTVPCLREE